MLWEIAIQPKESDPEKERVSEDYNLLTHSQAGSNLFAKTARGYLLQGKLENEPDRQALVQLLVDPLAESSRLSPLNQGQHHSQLGRIFTVLLKPGVMDPAALSVKAAASDLGIKLEAVGTFRRYILNPGIVDIFLPNFKAALTRVLANEAIEQVVEGPLSLDHLTLGSGYSFQLVKIPLSGLDELSLEELSRKGQLSLNRGEMRAVQEHFRSLQREPTDIELETIAQTWSEHCSHKTLKGRINFNGRFIDNLLKETIFGATQEIRRRFGPADWCVSVFEDNAGVVRFDDHFHVCFKVETHNHPSAIEPYGGANTGLGGVIRDPLGTGLGARPICNTDVFCFAPPNTDPETLPSGVLHPKKVMKGVVAGVRDYGNRMGVPTINGAICFNPSYLGNPLVFCGTVGLIPVNRCHKETRAGDLIVAVGGRTGRDGIHGATFSSIELTSESEKVSGGAVQIGNAITEKKLLDVLLQARDRGLFHAITDCGAGGFSSAIGEMAEHLGARVRLHEAPLKYEGLSYTEIWISESQERMVLAVPPLHWEALESLCHGEDVEATIIGTFEASGRLQLFYWDNQVADLDMKFLHHGRPPLVRKAFWPPENLNKREEKSQGSDAEIGSTDRRSMNPAPQNDFTGDLLDILSSYNVCSKEWVIRQYDHEVQGASVIKPLVGAKNDGPGDAAVIAPVLGSWAGLAIGCGINPYYGDLDPYGMAAAGIDEAVRNVVAVGADPGRIALLDNFCWGNTDRPEVLGSLVRAAEACRDVALAYNMPFISGKDSLNNEFISGNHHLTIPPTLLISALGRVPDVRRCVTMDFKEPGNDIYLIGRTKNEMGGSHFALLKGRNGGTPPQVDIKEAPRIFQVLFNAIQAGLVRACHDLSEGGLTVAIAEMAFAGNVGADLTNLAKVAEGLPEEALLFSESPSRFLVEVTPSNAPLFLETMGADVPLAPIGKTVVEPRLRIAGTKGSWIVWASLSDLKEAWQKPLRW